MMVGPDVCDKKRWKSEGGESVSDESGLSESRILGKRPVCPRVSRGFLSLQLAGRPAWAVMRLATLFRNPLYAQLLVAL